MSAINFSCADRIAAVGWAREDLYDFSRWMFLQRKGFPWGKAPHHRGVCDALMRVFNGECKRLIINIPPRYSKTELIKCFIAWTLGRAPDSEFIYTSYSSRLAAASSWDVRGMVQEEEYREIFPDVQLRNDSQAKDEWRTTEGGILYAVGSEGTITGYGAGKYRPGFGGAIIIDDPHKADEARSDVIRQGVLDWFQNTLESRKNSPDTPIILIMQRLHESDLAGWLLDGGNGEEWEHICLPAIQDDGTALWPEKHSIDELRRMERAAPYTFAGQYQQRPAPLEGGLFKVANLQTVDAIPAGNITWVRGWDFGASANGDYTVGGKLGRLSDGRFIISHVERGQWETDERDRALVNTAHADGVMVTQDMPQDPGQAGKSLILYLTRQLAGYKVKSSPETGDKITRAEPFAAQINVGNVLILRGAWNEPLKEEMRMFPNGKYDDQVDSLSRAFNSLMTKGGSIWGK